jgi:hypothetical protein
VRVQLDSVIYSRVALAESGTVREPRGRVTSAVESRYHKIGEDPAD